MIFDFQDYFISLAEYLVKFLIFGVLIVLSSINFDSWIDRDAMLIHNELA